MTNKFSASRIILWLFVIVLGITVGGGLYEGRVIVPLWAAALPDSVIGYYEHNVAYPRFAPNQGGNFWIFVTPFSALVTILTLISAWWTRGVHRKWRVAAAGLALTAYVFTFVWFVPHIIRLLGGDVLTMGRDEVSGLANLWLNLNWIRVALLMTAWLAAMRAMTISPDAGQEALNPADDVIESGTSVRQIG